ncbi:MAG TPA: DEAD/DEAH box helicase, partial [Puia sp.]|nr:DEAD/DEAH box helicase [Puia sp.]
MQTGVNQCLSAYRSWLESHYGDYYHHLKDGVDEYLDFIDGNKRIYGDAFLKNGLLRRCSTTMLSPFSRKYKTLAENRKAVANKIPSIEDRYSMQDYFDHAFVITNRKNVLREYAGNIEELKQQTDNWYGTVPDLIKIYLEKISGESLHPGFNQKQNIHGIESASKTLTSGISSEFGLTSQSAPFSNLHEIIQAIMYYRKELNLILSEFEICQTFYSSQQSSLHSLGAKMEEVIQPFRQQNIFIYPEPLLNSLNEYEKNLQQFNVYVQIVKHNLDQFRNYYNWRNFYRGQSELNQKVITAVVECGCENWTDTFECWYLQWLLSNHEDRHLPDNEDNIHAFIESKAAFKDSQIKSILHTWRHQQNLSLQRLSQMGISPSALYNKRGSRGEKRNSIRRIIKTDFTLFTDFFPVLMVSPSVCSSILPLQEGLFDIVIFDEASQLRLEDTFAALLRGKIRLVSGDSQQMPPSSYFQGGNAVLSPPEEEGEEEPLIPEIQTINRIYNSLDLAESESLLVYAENSRYKQSYLKIHYRSQHPSLIDFSNHAFYGKNLLPMPFKKEYKCIQYVEVNGLYEDQINRDEARQVVDILLNHIKPLANGKYPSIGVATFNIYQRNLILEEITKVRQQNELHDKKFIDLGSDFFVKNLENIQGDERDVIIISTTFGRKADGSFSQHFGPIIQSKGYKLLNVLITRAKLKVFICTSIPSENIRGYTQLLQQQKNNGRAVFYAYLAYAKAVSDKNIEQVDSILKQLYDNCDAKNFDIDHDESGSESP